MEDGKIPMHVGVIMDGNGRWAKRRLMPRSFGHNAGMNRMIGLAEHAQELGIKYLTVYVLSTENLSRPQEELDGLFDLFRKYFKRNIVNLYARNAGIRVIGDLSALPEDVACAIEEGVRNSPADAEFTMIFAINYGSRAEILRAVNLAAQLGGEYDGNSVRSLFYTDGIPDPDLIIRTGGEKRLSNFLTYQAAYAELYFTDVLFPDFSDSELDRALEDYAGRERRFGKI